MRTATMRLPTGETAEVEVVAITLRCPDCGKSSDSLASLYDLVDIQRGKATYVHVDHEGSCASHCVITHLGEPESSLPEVPPDEPGFRCFVGGVWS